MQNSHPSFSNSQMGVLGSVMDETKPVEELSYEEAFQSLKILVDGLESGEHPLEEALAMFERGQALASRCNELLGKAELKMQQLISDEDGGLHIAGFDGGEL